MRDVRNSSAGLDREIGPDPPQAVRPSRGPRSQPCASWQAWKKTVVPTTAKDPGPEPAGPGLMSWTSNRISAVRAGLIVPPSRVVRGSLAGDRERLGGRADEALLARRGRPVLACRHRRDGLELREAAGGVSRGGGQHRCAEPEDHGLPGGEPGPGYGEGGTGGPGPRGEVDGGGRHHQGHVGRVVVDDVEHVAGRPRADPGDPAERAGDGGAREDLGGYPDQGVVRAGL